MQLPKDAVLRGPLGYGHSRRLHKIDAFLLVLDGMIERGLVTLETVQVLRYGPIKPERKDVV